MQGRIEILSQLGANADGGVSRVALSDANLQRRAYIKGLMQDVLGLDVRVDAAGNIIGRRDGREKE